MNLEIIPINLPLPLNISDVHSYLLKTAKGCFLIDTGFTNSRKKLVSMLDRLGCQAGELKLIILTHGDFDHISNAIYLRELTGASIAMHPGDAGMLEKGDMFWNRKVDNRFMKWLMGFLLHFKAENRGAPDILLADGADLSAYGLEAAVINTPGHSPGSICLLSATGDLFCGDLFTNSTGKPMLNRMLYDQAAGRASFEKLRPLPIRTVYPGHGPPFAWQSFGN